MCELMALGFAEPVSADFSIHEFAIRGEGNADGWGLAWYPDRSLAVVKEPLKWRASRYTEFLESYTHLRSRIYIAHVRHKTTGGEPTHADTHPFAREWAGREYCLAHNGTLADVFRLPLRRFRPVGHTDSEHFFCYLLDEIATWEGGLAAEESWPRLHRKLAEVNRLGKLNCLLSDGRRLCCYHDAAGWKGLTFRKVHLGQDKPRRFEDPGVSIDVAGGKYNEGLVIATVPLSETGWHPFRPGELLVIADGQIRYSSHREHGAVPKRMKERGATP
jgi:predicted glutamine amidotransferase